MRLKPGLSEAERSRAIELIQQVTARQVAASPRRGARYVVTGMPVVVEGLADDVRSAIFVLLGAALLLMAATLALVFRTPPAAAAAGGGARRRRPDLRRAVAGRRGA